MSKTIDITCSECSRIITMCAQDARIVSRFNGGIPRLNITVKCPHCHQSSAVHDTPDARELLSEKIKARDFDEGGGNIIANSPEALLKFLGDLGNI